MVSTFPTFPPSKLNPQEDIAALELELLRLARLEDEILARDRFLAFIRYTMPTYLTSWHNVTLAKYLHAFALGIITRLIVCMGPRMGKTQQVSIHLPAYILGRDPDAQIIAVSHTATLAAKVNRSVQRVIDSPQYRRLFPETTLFGRNSRIAAEGNYLRNSDEFEIVGHRGRYYGRGVEQPVVGSGANFILIDDPIRGFKQAFSVASQKTVVEYVQAELIPRLNEATGGILVTHTRWTDRDLIAHLLELQEQNPSMQKYTVLNFPQILTLEADTVPEDPRTPGDGEVLWPSKFPAAFMEELRIAMGPRMWAAQQQGRPSVEGGNIFKRENIRYYDFDGVKNVFTCYRKGRAPIVIPAKDLTWYAYVDPSVEKKVTSDPIGMMAIGYSETFKVWLVKDAMQEKAEIIEQDRMIRSFAFKNRCLAAKIENAHTGKVLCQMAKSYNAGDEGEVSHDAIPYEECPTEGLAKETRAVQMAIHMEVERVFFLRDAPWGPMFENQILLFPNAKDDHLVDCFSMARFTEPEEMSPAEAILKRMNAG